MLAESSVTVADQMLKESIQQWMERCVRLAVTKKHYEISKAGLSLGNVCKATKLEYVKIPAIGP